MFDFKDTPSRRALSPAQTLRLFDFYMKGTRTIDDDNDIVLELCLDADSVLSRIQRPTRKSLTSIPSTSTASNEDMALHQGITSAYYELARLLGRLGHLDAAQWRSKEAEKWLYIQGSDNTTTEQKCIETSDSGLRGMVKAVQPIPAQTAATIAKKIFNHNDLPTVIRYSLPDAGAHLDDTHQLIYCLSLLPTIPIPATDLNDNESKWRQAISNDQAEHERLRKLVSDIIELYISGEIKSEAAVTEVVALTPVLDQAQFRTLLMAFVNGIKQNIMLETHLLEGLAQLMQHAPLGYLDSDDLVSILNTLSSRLQGTHAQSGDHLYCLSTTVSHVLNAMVSNQVKGLKREQLHEPLAAYLQGLKDSSDPYLVYQAAYAFQALQYIPDDETTMQAMLRRASAVFRGVFGVVSAVKDFDLNAFIGEISDIQEGLSSAADAIDVSLGVYEGTTSLYEGLSFSRKSAWYPALRGADALLQTGEFTKFKTLVCEASCRNDAAFQWGLCQRLGQIAADTQWSMDTRQDAITFLGEIYKNDQEWSDHAHVKQWVISILRKLSSLLPDGLQAAYTLLDDLEKHGDLKRQELYKNCLQGPTTHYPFIIHPPSTPSHLLDRAQNRSGVENSLRQLKRQRVDIGNSQRFYIQQYAKASPQASNDKLFLLMDKVKEFLDSDRKVLLVQGDSGSGKSTFNRALETTLWETYKNRHSRIPLFINLPAIDKPEKGLVAKQLRHHGFTEPQIKELKMNRSFILICDGYDESMQTNNLYVANQLNQPGEWRVQMVISCRTEYLGLDYRDRFQPMDRNHQSDTGLFQEAVIVPFSEVQIDDYIEQYVDAMDPLWQVKDYQRALQMVPSLQDLVKNPFILSMSLEVLPRMVDPDQYISNTKVKRVTLYDQFVEQWLERGKKRLSEALGLEDRRMFHKLLDEGFAQNGIKYLTDLALAIYRHQDGNPVVDYSPSKDRGTWKEEYFSKENGRNLLREASPLTRTGNQHRFIHRSILEYSLVRAIFEPKKAMSASAKKEEAKVAASASRRQSISSVFSFEDMGINEDEQGVDVVKIDEASPLVWRSFVDEPSIIQFLEDRVRLEPVFKQQLYTYVELSKSDNKWRVAAANAMTILVRAGESFIEADLRGIRIPGADLSPGIFEYAQLQGADLRKVNLRNCWLREADLSGAKMAGIQFGEWPLLVAKEKVQAGSYSPDGKALAAVVGNGADDYSIIIYDTSTWEKLWTLKDDGVYNLLYSPNSQHIATWGHYKGDILVLDITSGALVHRLVGHTDVVYCAVYSPNGNYLASASGDTSVRVWDAQSGVLKYILEGHTSSVLSVAYSPNGLQIATGGLDKTLRLWDAISGHQVLILENHGYGIEQIVYSPNGQEFKSHWTYDRCLDVWSIGSDQKKFTLEHTSYVKGVQYSPNGKFAASFAYMTAYQWDMQTGKVIHTLEGHSAELTDLKYSPNGERIATCGQDNTVQLWDTRSGQLMNTFYGHSGIINCVAYSPINHQIASFSDDGTIRLWDTRPQQTNHGPQSHPKWATSVRSSPDRQQIASSSNDGAVRMWEARTGRLIHVLQRDEYARELKYSPDGRLLTFCTVDSSQVCLWDTRTGQVAQTLGLQGEQANALGFSPLGHQIACGQRNGDVTVWNTQTGEHIRTLKGSDTCVDYLVFSPSGHQIASYDDGGNIRVWASQSGDLQFEVTDEEHYSPFLLYMPDSRKIMYYYGSNADILRVRDADTGEPWYDIMLMGFPTIPTFPPCGQQMAVGSSKGPISVVETESGAALHTLEGHTGCIYDLAYSLDGRYIASCSSDMTVRMWDSELGQCLLVIPFVGAYVISLVWSVSEEGYWLVTGCEDGSIRMWQIILENERYQYRLKWSTRQMVLNASNTCIQDVDGLSEVNRKLLMQHGAMGEQSSLKAVHEAFKQTVAASSMASKPKANSNQLCHNQGPSAETSLETEALKGGEPSTTVTVPSRSIKDYQFKYSMCSECSFEHIILCSRRG